MSPGSWLARFHITMLGAARITRLARCRVCAEVVHDSGQPLCHLQLRLHMLR